MSTQAPLSPLARWLNLSPKERSRILATVATGVAEEAARLPAPLPAPRCHYDAEDAQHYSGEYDCSELPGL